MIKKYWWLPAIIITYLLALSFIYPMSYAKLAGDQQEYYSWARDIFTHQGGFFSWTKTPGYNVYSIIYLFSYLIGSFTYKSAGAFFTIVNYFELILIPLATFIFIKLTKFNQYKLRTWFHVLAIGIVIWTILCISESKSTLSSVYLQVTNEYLIFVDSFIIISIGWFLNILTSTKEHNKLPTMSFIGFILYSLYFSLTTLRFLSGGILTEIALIILFTLNHYRQKTSKSIQVKSHYRQRTSKSIQVKSKPTSSSQAYDYNRWLLILLISLVLIFIVGYVGFFMLETYSTSARYILRGGELSTAAAWANGFTALKGYFSAFNSDLLALLLRLSYLTILIYGTKAIYDMCVRTDKPIKDFNLTQVFAMLAVINFIAVTLSGLFSHSVVFLVINFIAHYYELSAIFAFLSVISFIVAKLDTYPHLSVITIVGLIICSIGSIIYINSTPTQSSLMATMKCINLNKNKYQLQNGMGDYWGINALMLLNKDNNMRFSVIGDGPSLTNYNWLSNITKTISNNNFVIYWDQNYKNSVLNEINNKVPNLSYQDIACNDKGNTKLLVFSAETTKYIDKFRQVEFNNSKAWLYITNYGFGQSLWAKAPWHKNFIKKHHEYLYYGSMLSRIAPDLTYSVNPDLSLNITGHLSTSNTPFLMNDMWIRASKGPYYLSTSYTSNTSAHILIYNPTTKQIIGGLTLKPSVSNQLAQLKFSLDKVTTIYLLVTADRVDSLNLTINNIKLGKEISN